MQPGGRGREPVHGRPTPRSAPTARQCAPGAALKFVERHRLKGLAQPFWMLLCGSVAVVVVVAAAVAVAVVLLLLLLLLLLNIINS